MLSKIGHDTLKCLWQYTKKYRTTPFYFYALLTTCTTICLIVLGIIPALYMCSECNGSDLFWTVYSFIIYSVLMWQCNLCAQWIYDNWQHQNKALPFTISYHP